MTISLLAHYCLPLLVHTSNPCRWKADTASWPAQSYYLSLSYIFLYPVSWKLIYCKKLIMFSLSLSKYYLMTMLYFKKIYQSPTSLLNIYSEWVSRSFITKISIQNLVDFSQTMTRQPLSSPAGVLLLNMTQFSQRRLLQFSGKEEEQEAYFLDYIPPARDAITLPRNVVYVLAGVALIIVATYAIVGHLIKDLMHDLAGNPELEPPGVKSSLDSSVCAPTSRSPSLSISASSWTLFHFCWVKLLPSFSSFGFWIVKTTAKTHSSETS